MAHTPSCLTNRHPISEMLYLTHPFQWLPFPPFPPWWMVTLGPIKVEYLPTRWGPRLGNSLGRGGERLFVLNIKYPINTNPIILYTLYCSNVGSQKVGEA